MKRTFAFSIAISLALVSLGCGQKKPDGMPSLEPATLKVVQDGAPCAGANVNLKALDSSNKWTCGGTTDETGVVTLKTHGQYKGVPVGKYKVAVSKTVGEGTPPPPSPIDEESARVFREYQESGATYEEFAVVDKQYMLIETTPLEIEIVKGKNELTVDVGAAVHDPIDAGRGVL